VVIDIERKFRFREFKVYQDVRDLNSKIKELTKKTFPAFEQFSLMSQLWRALDSIVLNIAEGADRGTDRDFAHFLNQAHTSVNEVVACLDIALDSKYISNQLHEDLLNKSADIANQLTAFKKKLLTEDAKKVKY